ncbi:wall-associated receptor kinase 5-like [Arachis hypogaea]|nr:wall-associated receptor kinase 5-like [Arachis hypogaea]
MSTSYLWVNLWLPWPLLPSSPENSPIQRYICKLGNCLSKKRHGCGALIKANKLVVVVGGASALHYCAASCPNQSKCGNVMIPFPFSTVENCCLDTNFFISCTNNVPYLPLPLDYDGDLPVLIRSPSTQAERRENSQIMKQIRRNRLLRHAYPTARSVKMQRTHRDMACR